MTGYRLPICVTIALSNGFNFLFDILQLRTESLRSTDSDIGINMILFGDL